MKHLEITSLKQFSVVFSSKTFKAKKDLLAEAALLTVVPFDKDKEAAAKLSEAMRELANEIKGESSQLIEWLEMAIANNRYATSDFIEPLSKESARLLVLSQNGETTTEPPKKQWNFHKKKGETKPSTTPANES